MKNVSLIIKHQVALQINTPILNRKNSLIRARSGDSASADVNALASRIMRRVSSRMPMRVRDSVAGETRVVIDETGRSLFETRLCGRCNRGRDWDWDGYWCCEIFERAVSIRPDDPPSFPEEWTYDKYDNPVCAAFEPPEETTKQKENK